MHSKNNNNKKVGGILYLWGISSNTLCASAAGSTSELAGASVAAAPVARPASFFLDGFEEPEPSAALFFFVDTLPFFGRAAFGSFDRGARGFTAGAGATPPAAEVIRGGIKRPHAMTMLGGAPAEAKPKLPELGFAAAAAAEGWRE
jgi:hypothetical protein